MGGIYFVVWTSNGIFALIIPAISVLFFEFIYRAIFLKKLDFYGYLIFPISLFGGISLIIFEKFINDPFGTLFFIPAQYYAVIYPALASWRCLYLWLSKRQAVERNK